MNLLASRGLYEEESTTKMKSAHVRKIVGTHPTTPTSAASRLASVVMAALLALSITQAQDFTNVTALKRFALTKNKQYDSTEKLLKKFATDKKIPYTVTGDKGQFMILHSIDGGRPRYRSEKGIVDAQTVGVHKLWPGGELGLGLTGLGQVLGIWEAGGNPDPNHPELAGRITIKDSNTNISDHAMHVAGIMAATGINFDAKGMAYQSSLSAYDASRDDVEAALESANGMQVSNHSYGPVPGWSFSGEWFWFGDPAISATKDWFFGFYDNESRTWDDMVYNAPYYLPIASAGNERNPGVPSGAFEHNVWQNGGWVKVTADRDDQDRYDTISGFVIGKNVLCIGAAEGNANGINNPTQARLAGFSSSGPTDDGRIKPDLVAVGVNVFSTFPGDSYGFSSGTSMSSPNTAGAVGLLNQHYFATHNAKPFASTMKALMIHTAKEAGRVTFPFFDTPAGPDYMFGWGFLDAAAAAEKITQSGFDAISIQELTLDQGQTIEYPIVATNAGEVKVTIAWTDPAGTVSQASNDDRKPKLVNDLDLRIIRSSDSQEFQPWVLDPDNPSAAATTGDNFRDNVEQVVIATPTPGLYTVRISHKGNQLRPSGRQVVSVITTAIAPDGFEALSLSPESVIGGLQNATATLTLTAPAVGNQVVTVRSSNPAAASVPSSVVVPDGEDQVTIPVTTYNVRPPAGRSSVDVSIVAASELGSRSILLHVLPVGVASFTINPDEVVGGNFTEATVTLNAPAGKFGASVVITSDRPSIARSIRNWILIPAGQTSARVKVRTSAVSDQTGVVLTASRLGSSLPAEVIVRRATLVSAVVNPSSVFSRQNVKLVITLDGLAPNGGTVVELSADRRDLVGIPTSVTIPAGRKSVILNIPAGTVTANTDVTIVAKRGGVSRAARFTIKP